MQAKQSGHNGDVFDAVYISDDIHRFARKLPFCYLCYPLWSECASSVDVEGFAFSPAINNRQLIGLTHTRFLSTKISGTATDAPIHTMKLAENHLTGYTQGVADLCFPGSILAVDLGE